MATLEETLRSLGLSAARGIPQLATGFVDLAALPFTATGLLKPEQAVGSTAYLTSKGLLPPEQQGLLNQTTELVSGAMNPAGAAKTIGLLGATKASKEAMDAIRKMSAERVPTDLSWVNNPVTEGPKNILELYHGTSPAAAKAIEKSGFDINKAADGTVWFTSNPNIGEVAASNKGAVVKRLLDKNKMKLGGWAETDKYSTDELINMGYDGLMLKDGDAVTYQIFNPQKLIKR
jgi:hypothetical protein